jgi:hypothetical protein
VRGSKTVAVECSEDRVFLQPALPIVGLSPRVGFYAALSSVARSQCTPMGSRAHVLTVWAKTLIAMERKEEDGAVPLLTSSEVERNELFPGVRRVRCGNLAGAGPLVGPAHGHDFVAKMKPCMWQCKPQGGKAVKWLINPFVTSGTYTSHLQRVFSSPLG